MIDQIQPKPDGAEEWHPDTKVTASNEQGETVNGVEKDNPRNLYEVVIGAMIDQAENSSAAPYTYVYRGNYSGLPGYESLTDNQRTAISRTLGAVEVMYETGETKKAALKRIVENCLAVENDI